MVFIFNPETEIALASGGSHYSPSRNVLEARLRLTPVIASALSPGDSILIFSEEEEERLQSSDEMAPLLEKGISVITPAMLGQPFPSYYADKEEYRLEVWGWNTSLRAQLLRIGFESESIPSEKSIEEIRRLANRRITMPFNKQMNLLLGLSTPLPIVFTNVQEAFDFVLNLTDGYLKSPWSSSGRGVARITGLNSSSLEARIKSTIKKQGSIIFEQAADKKLDFATEWVIKNGKAHYLGLSLFQTVGNGFYNHNLLLPQNDLNEIIKKEAPTWSSIYIEAQRSALDALVSPHYEGPLGIDMLVDSKGIVWPCIEINFRHTMGHVALAKTGVNRFATYNDIPLEP